jgi:nucleoside-diphosphate-sugar epimerase
MASKHTPDLPPMISSVDQLDDLLSEPASELVQRLERLEGDLIILGVAGKMGPTLAWMARRAFEQAGVRRRVIGVARFNNQQTQSWLEAHGIETLRCDLLDPAQLATLPDVANVVFMAGMKFGTTGNEALTWAMNVLLPGMVCRHFQHSRIVAFSTGNVYGLSPVARGGSAESDSLQPAGEYAMSCVGRERIFEHFSRSLGVRTVILRLNYASELRYGVLVDLAQRIWRGEPVDLSMGYFNVIWQGDANAMALAMLDQAASPPFVVNIAGPELLSVRRVSEQLAERLGRPVQFVGTEANDALLSNGRRGREIFGLPRIGVEQMIAWVADWVSRGATSLGKPTHFEIRDGHF